MYINICVYLTLSFTPYMYMYSDRVANHGFYQPHDPPKKMSSKNNSAIQICPRRFSSLSPILPSPQINQIHGFLCYLQVQWLNGKVKLFFPKIPLKGFRGL